MSANTSKDRCANWIGGECLGVMVHDNLTMTRFRPERQVCVLKGDKQAKCEYFEKIVIRGLPSHGKRLL